MEKVDTMEDTKTRKRVLDKWPVRVVLGAIAIVPLTLCTWLMIAMYVLGDDPFETGGPTHRV